MSIIDLNSTFRKGKDKRKANREKGSVGDAFAQGMGAAKQAVQFLWGQARAAQDYVQK